MSRVGEPLGPWWFERQVDPGSPDFVPGSGWSNTTHRDYVQLGTVGTSERAVVDPRGLVTMPHGFSLDWWIGAEDRWHVPAREVALRQQRVDGAPVIETAMRVPGGDAIHRAYAIQHALGPIVIVEIENGTAIPFAVALAVAPYNPVGPVDVRMISVRGTTVEVDGSLAMVLPKRAARAAAECGVGALATVIDGSAAPPNDHEVVACDDRRAHMALIFPLPHTARLQVLLPLHPNRATAFESIGRISTRDEVTRGWRAQVDRGAAVALPDDRLRAAFDAARKDLLLLAAGEDVVVWPNDPVPATVSMRVIEALDLFGLHDETEQLLAAFPDEQRSDGSLISVDDSLGSNGAVLYALARHWQLTRDEALIERLIGPIARAGHWIEKKRTARRRPLLLPGHEVDVSWSIRGLSAIVPALVAAGQPEVAKDFAGFARRLTEDLEQTRVTRPTDPPRLADGLVVDDSGWGLSPSSTLGLARVELLADDPRAVERLYAVLDHKSPVDTWPEVIHPRTRGGARGRGHDPATTAALCSFVRTMLVDDWRGDLTLDEPQRLRLCPLVPDAWLGQPWEVHDLPTAHGRLGFAVRWHGERPALLWELEPHEHAHDVHLTAPGLDQRWSATGLRGEALLRPKAPAAEPEPPPAEGGSEASSSFA